MKEDHQKVAGESVHKTDPVVYGSPAPTPHTAAVNYRPGKDIIALSFHISHMYTAFPTLKFRNCIVLVV